LPSATSHKLSSPRHSAHLPALQHPHAHSPLESFGLEIVEQVPIPSKSAPASAKPQQISLLFHEVTFILAKVVNIDHFATQKSCTIGETLRGRLPSGNRAPPVTARRFFSVNFAKTRSPLISGPYCRSATSAWHLLDRGAASDHRPRIPATPQLL
jgi:hypothetical protein